MKLNRLSLLLVTLSLLYYPSACFSMWHCGDIDLPAEPSTVIIDPVTGDIFVGAATAHLMRIDEATYEVSQFDLVDVPQGLGLNPSSRLLYACHSDRGMITVTNIETGDTVLIEVGEVPSGVAVDPISGLVHVANSGDSTISVIEGPAVVDTIECAGSPTAVAVDPWTGKAFATLTDSHLLLAFDASSGDTSYFATGLEPADIEIDPEKGKLYIANSGEATITVCVIDSDSTFSVPIGGAPTTLALNPETGHLFVGSESNNLTIVDTETYLSQNIGLPSVPEFVTIDALSDRAFASLPDVGLLVEIDGGGDTLLISVPQTPGMLVVNPVTNKCYVSDPGSEALSVFEAANFTGKRIATGGGPGAVRINLETHKVYTPNWFTAGLTVVDGYTDAVSTIPTADGPNGVGIDPVSDDIYVVCAWANKVTIKRNDSPDTLLVPIGDYAHGMGINPNTQKVYVSNRYSRDLSVIDMETLDTTLVRMGAYPCNVDLNLDHNRIYVTNRTSWTLTVVDGALLSTTYARIGPGPTGCYVEPLTNKIWTIDSGGRTVSVVDGITLERVVVPAGTSPRSIGINPNTHTVYASSGNDGDITVIDGDTYRRTPVTCAEGIFGVVCDPWLDRAFTACWTNASVYLIDGNFLSRLRIPVGEEPHGVAYDPVLEKLYVSNHAMNSLEIIKLREKIAPRLEVTIDSLPGDVAYTPTPTITGTAASLRGPRNYGIMKVLYKIDNLRDAWNEAIVVGEGTTVTWELTTAAQLLGRHHVFVAAVDSTAGSLSSSSLSSLVRMSDIACYEFTCLSPPPETPESLVPDDGLLGAHRLAWTSTCGGEGWYDIELSSDPYFSDGLTRIERTNVPSYTVAASEIGGADGLCYWRVAAVDYPHGKRSDFSPVYTISLADSPGDETEPALALPALTVYPTPSWESVSLRLIGRNPAETQCAVYDVAGRFVAAIPLVASDDGLTGSWNATDIWGNRLPQGVYYARIRVGEKTFEHKIILLR